MQNVQYNTLMIQTASKHLKLEAIFGMSQDTDTHIFDCQKGLNQLEYLWPQDVIWMELASAVIWQNWTQSIEMHPLLDVCKTIANNLVAG